MLDRLINMANNLVNSSITPLDEDKTMFITDSGYTIRNLIQNKSKFYRILFDSEINRWMIGEGIYTIHADLLNKATEQGWYPDLVDDFISPIDYLEDSFLDGTIEAYSFAPKTMNVDRDRYEDGYATKLVYDFGNLYVMNYLDWRDAELVNILGKPNKVIMLDELYS